MRDLDSYQFLLTQSRKEKTMTENEIAKIIVDAAYHIHRRLGLLINFGASLIKDGIFRVANRL